MTVRLVKRYYQRRKILHQYDESATVDEDQLIGRLSLGSPVSDQLTNACGAVSISIYPLYGL